MYRPEGWEKLKAKQMEGIPEILGGNRDFFIEAGADAMLEGLKNSNEPSCEVLETSMGVKAYGPSFKGKLVFIPEEE